VALNPVFILGRGPFPRMGIAGLAAATRVANLISLVALMTDAYVKDLPVRLRGGEWSYLRPRMRFILTIVGRGIVISMQMFLMAVAGLALLGLVNRAGSTVLAAYGATDQIWTYIQMPSMAVAAAVSAMAAQNIGAGRWDRLGDIAKSGVLITSVVTAIMASAILLLDHWVLALFLQADGAAVPIAEHINRVAIWSWLVLGMSMIPGSIVRASGAVMVPLLILMVSIFPVRLGFAHGFEPHYRPDAIWWSMIVGAIASFAMTVGYYRWGGWRNVRLQEKVHAPSAVTVTTDAS
jgi:Na+-driven multidrug efflux pump